MSTPTAKDLLAQADRMMRQRTPEELPVLTDLVVEEIEVPGVGDSMDSLIPTQSRHGVPLARPPAAAPGHTPAPATALPPVTARTPLPGASVANAAIAAGMPGAPARPAAATPPLRSSAAPQRPLPSVTPGVARGDDLFGVRPRMAHDAPAPSPISSPPTTTASTNQLRDQFNAQLLAKLEELQHSVFSQVMQQLELHAAGALKTHLRLTLEPALMDIARDIADQVAEDTSAQVREVVSKAVDSEIARLREQIARKRSTPPVA